jgi:hypothetical protein
MDLWSKRREPWRRIAHVDGGRIIDRDGTILRESIAPNRITVASAQDPSVAVYPGKPNSTSLRGFL